MKFYEITIRPLSAFGTSLKGDTIFGHFCWQAAYESSLVDGGIEKALAQYGEKPFAVFSSAYPKFEREAARYLLKRPDLPLSWLFPASEESREQHYENMKKRKKEKWMLLDSTLKIEINNIRFLSDKDLLNESKRIAGQAPGEHLLAEFLRPHNTINRLTGTTGTGEFAPYSILSHYYLPETELALFVLVDEEMTTIDAIIHGLDRIGQFGFGKDASTGMGRFRIMDKNELALPDGKGANAFYTLSPCVPEHFEQIYFTPFIRFGKHGDRLAGGGNPFKNPVIMADEGAVILPGKGTSFDKPYVGRAVRNVSKVQPEAVVQGYTPYLPVKMER